MSGDEVHVAPRFYLCRALGVFRAREPVRLGFWRSPGDHQARRRSPLEQMTLYPVDRMGYAAGAPFAFVVAAVVPGLRNRSTSKSYSLGVTMTKNFIIHGFYLLVVTSVAVMYNPHTNAFGFNPNAKSALIVGGSFAVISFFWAYIYSRNARRAAIIGGIITTLLLFAGTIPRAVGEWGGVASGDTVRWFAALTISLVIVVSIPLFGALLRAVRTPSR